LTDVLRRAEALLLVSVLASWSDPEPITEASAAALPAPVRRAILEMAGPRGVVGPQHAGAAARLPIPSDRRLKF
jgi:hypothetical protein